MMRSIYLIKMKKIISYSILLFISLVIFGCDELPPDGLKKSYYKNDQLYTEGNYKDGKKDGLWKTYFINSKLEYEVYYNNGIVEGLLKVYYENGQLKTIGTLKDGKPDGPLEIYYENGQLMLTCFLTPLKA